jgi:hypothetical protein
VEQRLRVIGRFRYRLPKGLFGRRCVFSGEMDVGKKNAGR